MTQRYGKVHARFWHSAKRNGWDAETCLLALYLLTGPHCTIAGVMRLPIGYMAHDLSLSVDTVSDRLSILYRYGFCTYDEQSEWMVIDNRLLYDEPRGCKQVGGVLNVLRDLPQGHPGWVKILPRLQSLIADAGMAAPAWLEAVATPPSDTVSDTESITGARAAFRIPHPSRYRETTLRSVSLVQPEAAGQDAQPVKRKRAKPVMDRTERGVEFEGFWAEYPKHEGKRRARAAYDRARETASAEAILVRLRKAKATWREERSGRKYYPLATSWLNGEEWTPPPKPNGSGAPMQIDRAMLSEYERRARKQVETEGLDVATHEGRRRKNDLIQQYATEEASHGPH